jgi:hypothetical protein
VLITAALVGETSKGEIDNAFEGMKASSNGDPMPHIALAATQLRVQRYVRKWGDHRVELGESN